MKRKLKAFKNKSIILHLKTLNCEWQQSKARMEVISLFRKGKLRKKKKRGKIISRKNVDSLRLSRENFVVVLKVEP